MKGEKTTITMGNLNENGAKFFGAGGSGNMADSINAIVNAKFVEYIPDPETYAGTCIVTLDKTGEEICQLVNSGKIVHLVSEPDVSGAGGVPPVITIGTAMEEGSNYTLSAGAKIVSMDEWDFVSAILTYRPEDNTWELKSGAPVFYMPKVEGLLVRGNNGQFYNLMVDAEGNVVAIPSEF